MLVALTERNDIFVFEGATDMHSKNLEDESLARIIKFNLVQHIQNCFSDHNIHSTRLKTMSQGLVVGSSQGHLLFVEKVNLINQMYQPIRYTSREKTSKVTNLAFNYIQDMLAVSFNSNEVCHLSMNNIFENLRNNLFEVDLNIVCDGFHQGPVKK